MNIDSPSYAAKERYTNVGVAKKYDAVRFSSPWGRKARQLEESMLCRALDRHLRPNEQIILDLPCGTGRMFPKLSGRGLRIIGADISPAMLTQARASSSESSGATLLVADGETLPFTNDAVDCVISLRFFCHLPKPVRKTVLAEMRRISRRLVVVNYHFASFAPLAIFNRIFRPHSYPAYPANLEELKDCCGQVGLRVLDVAKLSWYERCSAIVVLEKTG